MAGQPVSRDFIRKILGDPSLFPDEFQSWIQRLIPGNPLIKLDNTQIPTLEKLSLIGGTNEPVFQHGSAFGSGLQEPGFYKDPWGIAHLVGVVGATYAAGNIIATLPAGYRPLEKEVFAVLTDTGIGRVDVDASGNITFMSGGTTFVSLSGIAFRVY